MFLTTLGIQGTLGTPNFFLSLNFFITFAPQIKSIEYSRFDFGL